LKAWTPYKQRFLPILKLLKTVAVRHPATTVLWTVIPILTGLTIYPIVAAERELIDLAIRYAGRETAGFSALRDAWPSLIVLAGASVGTVLLGVAGRLSDAWMADRAGQRVLSEIQLRSVGAPLERFEDAGFYDRLSRAQAAAGAELTGILRNAAETVRQAGAMAGMLTIAASGHPMVAVLLFLACWLVLARRLRLEIDVKRSARERTTDGRMADELKRTLADPAAMKELKVFGATGYVKRLWYAKASAYEIVRNDYRRKEGKASAGFALAFAATLFLSLAILLLRLDNGALTIGTVAVVFQTILQSQNVPMQLSFTLSKLYVQGTKASDLAEFVSEPYQEETGTAGHLPAEPIRTIRFENVGFTYPGSTQATLSGINLTLRAGEKVALVGDNGSGKSTFVKLMLGLFEPTEGTVFVNGRDVRLLNKRALWHRVGAVFQDFGHYPLSVRDFLLAGGRAERDMAAALRACGLHALSEDGNVAERVLTRAYEDGQELSGGQWQRLAVARALLREGDVVVLDEPTSAIDPSGELELYKSCEQTSKGKLAVFVSHRLGWARRADRIVVLERGGVAEEGSHSELIDRNGKYASAFRAQAAWYA